ncbi:arylesterase [Pelagicoccus albus]|uniref:Arylesterase n=2 Tax=Pelagicoccus albus TaxID=415222 RepID=A0A7X1B8X8_9BACT|nr:arylesterase [Pelagicoccus albus]
MKQTRLASTLIAIFLTVTVLASPSSAQDSARIVFLGDSLTAGYGIDPELAYPSLIEKRIQDQGLNYEVTAAGLSGETSAGGLRRANWILQKPADILVVALGANDGLRGMDLSDTKQNLQKIIDLARQKYPDIQIVLAGMKMPPNLGDAYTKEFSEMYPDLAQKNELPLIPFLLEGVGGHPELNIADGIHPNAEGHEILAENVWEVLAPLLSD